MNAEPQSTTDRVIHEASEILYTTIRNIPEPVVKVTLIPYVILCMIQMFTAPIGILYPVMISNMWQEGNMAAVAVFSLLTVNYTFLMIAWGKSGAY